MKRLFSAILLAMLSFVGVMAQDTWTVAGAAAALNGNDDWSPTNSENDMITTDNENYTLTVTNCTLEQGVTYEYKVVKNHAWDEAYPSSNEKFSVDETAAYTVVYTFNASTHEVGQTTTKTGEAGDITHAYTVAGDFTPKDEALEYEGIPFFGSEWDINDANNNMVSEDGVVYTLTKDGISLYAGTYEYKVVVDHSWGVAYPAANASFYVEADGEYNVVISFNATTKEVNAEVTAVEKPLVIESMSIVGELTGGWPTEEDWSMAKAMVQDPDNPNIWSLTLENVELEAGSYNYKATANGKWGDYELPSSGNQVCQIDEAGTFHLTFTANTESHELTLIADRQATYADLLTLPGDETYTEGKFFMVEAADEASGNIRLTAGETVLNEIMEDGTAMIEITNSAFTSGEFTISADKELTLTKVSLFDDPDAAEGIQIWPEVNPENAVIASVDIRGEFNGWSGGQNMLELTAENTYTGVLDLTDIAYDQEFKLVVNAEGGNGDIWIGTNQLTLDVPEGWVAADGQGNNFKLLNSTTGYQSYTFTANWTASPDAAAGWTLKIEGKDVREVEIPDAVITNVEIRGAFNDWTAGVNVLEPTDAENVYEGTIDLTATQDDQEFKLVVNAEGVENDIWIGNGSDTQFNTTEGWIVGLEEGNWNYVLKNSITGFQTYTVKAAWTPSTDAGKGWTLTISGKDQRIATGIEAWRTEFEDGHYYNLQGVRITNPKRGVYIHNGQKIVVK